MLEYVHLNFYWYMECLQRWLFTRKWLQRSVYKDAMKATNAWVYEVSMMFSDVEKTCSVWEERLPYIQNLILQRQNNISSIYNFLNSDSTLFLKTVSTVSESWLSCLCLNVMWIYVVLVAAVFATFSFACESILSWLLQCLPHILLHANAFWKCQSPFSSFGCIHMNFA